jgi:GT2 family glycosyltransferase
MGTPPDVSVIIVNRNTADLLAACLASLSAQEGTLSIETIVIDNCSSDGSAERVQRDFPQVALIANTETVNDTAASNQGLRLAQGRYLLLLSPATVMQPGALAAMLSFAEAHPAAGIIGPRLVYPDGSLQPSAGPAPRLLPALAAAYGLRRDPLLEKGRDYTRVSIVDQVSGACLLIRREAMDKSGLLDEGLLTYFDDVDWCLRVQQQGWQVYYLPAAEVVHNARLNQSRQPQQDAAYATSEVRFFQRYRGRAQALILRSVLASAAALKVVAFSIALPFSAARRPVLRQHIDTQRRIIYMCFHTREAQAGLTSQYPV